ncbi:MAG TPA: adenylate/guanylate cyclase domain-containing protein [Pseudomonadota bacterium]|nr:adenylate/guanylate cyclase domain-containing protein [Pseudomonadota bacterium]
MLLSREDSGVAQRETVIIRFMPMGIVVHVILGLLFLLLGVRGLAFYNIISVTVFVLASLLARRGWLAASVTLGALELILHQSLCVHYLGWETGFQYWLLGMLPLYFFMPDRLSWLSVLSVVYTLAAFIFLYFAEHNNPSGTMHLLPAVSRGLFLGNLVNIFAMVAFAPWQLTRDVDRAQAALRQAHARTEELLYNTLPKEIALRLHHSEVVADHVAEVSVLFADIVGFTPLAEKLPPQQLLALLDEIFSRFDSVVDQLGLEKIKTIGDAYMAAAGVPRRRTDHASAIAELALSLQEITRSIAETRGLPLAIRIGLHSGPVVAGVIGRRKFAYDLWGDTVNTAARLESHGLPSEIQMSAATRDALGSKWLVEDRGPVTLKGKGTVQAYLLRGRRADPGAAV